MPPSRVTCQNNRSRDPIGNLTYGQGHRLHDLRDRCTRGQWITGQGHGPIARAGALGQMRKISPSESQPVAAMHEDYQAQRASCRKEQVKSLVWMRPIGLVQLCPAQRMLGVSIAARGFIPIG